MAIESGLVATIATTDQKALRPSTAGDQMTASLPGGSG